MASWLVMGTQLLKAMSIQLLPASLPPYTGVTISRAFNLFTLQFNSPIAYGLTQFGLNPDSEGEGVVLLAQAS